MNRFLLTILLFFFLWVPPGFASAASKELSFFGTMLAFQSNHGLGQPGLVELLMESWLQLRESDRFSDFISEFKTVTTGNAKLVKKTGFASNRDLVGAFVWNVIEPTPGEYDWKVSDATLRAAGKANVDVSAVVQPFSSWGSSETMDQICQAIDFAYFDYYTGSPKKWDAYKKFLRKTVERYDGDGVNDMPHLKTRVVSWEIGNEVEGPCGGNLAEAERYVKLLRVSSKVIKKADPDAVVLNAGALEIIGSDGLVKTTTKKFWKEFFHLKGHHYLDALNIHYNLERAGPYETMATWKQHLRFFSKLNRQKLPIWVTEFGTFSGTNTERNMEQSEEEQASWYLRYIVVGMYSGIERYYFDRIGKDDDTITSASLYHADGDARLFLTTLQTLGKKINGYTTVKKIRDGQYRFFVDGRFVYVLWDGKLPNKLKGKVRVYHIDGSSKVLKASKLKYSTSQPIIVVSD